jgi:hypothetical protein
MHPFSWLTLDVFLKIFMPLLTFALGVFVTAWAKKRELQNELLREHVLNLVALASEWYKQVLELRGKSLFPDASGDQFTPAFYMYKNNRLVLPKMLFSLEMLKNSGRYPELVKTVQEFLDVVTVPQGNSVIDADFGIAQEPTAFTTLSQNCDISAFQRPVWEAAGALDGVLQTLDRLTQQMARLAGVALSRKASLADSKARRDQPPKR